MVDPQGESFFTINSWMGTLAISATARNNPAEAPSVAYLAYYWEKIPLIVVVFDNNSFVELNLVICLMFLWVVRVNTMSHISTDNETLMQGLVVRIGLVVTRTQDLVDPIQHGC